MTQETRYYVCGGEYRKGDKREFALVSPTRGLPYVRLDYAEAHQLMRLCEHHSHLYWFDDTFSVLTLLEESAWAMSPVFGVGSPKTVPITESMRRELQQVIEAEMTPSE